MSAPDRPAQPTRDPIAYTLLGAILLFLVLELGVAWLAGWLDPTWSALIASVAMVALALLLERVFFHRAPRAALYILGYKRVDVPSLVVGACVVLVMLAFFPIFAAATGAQLTLKSDWLWILVGAIALNGIAEETLFRGYVFGGLRRGGLSFARSGFISLLVFAAVHLVLFLQNPPIVAFLATLVAITAAYPMAYLFERGHNTLWGPVLVHVGTHAIRLVDIPEPYYMTGLVAWIAFQIATPFLIFAFRGYLRTRAAPALETA
jgi:membrane protease YdiL (CAAX protease family)